MSSVRKKDAPSHVTSGPVDEGLAKLLQGGRRRNRFRRILVAVVLLLIAAGAGFGVLQWNKGQAEASMPRYTTAPITRGDLISTISATGTVEALNTGDFDPRVTAVLPPESAGIASAVHPGGLETAPQVVTALPGRLVLDVSATADGLLVISQPFYPGWRADVDGEQVPIYRVDYLLQGLPLTAGDHRVELRYHLPPLPAIISLVALVGCVVALLLARRRNRPQGGA